MHKEILRQILDKADGVVFCKYVSGLVDAIPTYIYQLLISFFIIGEIIILTKKEGKRK